MTTSWNKFNPSENILFYRLDTNMLKKHICDDNDDEHSNETKTKYIKEEEDAVGQENKNENFN